MSYFWPPAEGFHFYVYNIHRYYHNISFKKGLLTLGSTPLTIIFHLAISDELFFHSEAQEDALLSTQAQ